MYLKCIQNNDSGELLSFAANILISISLKKRVILTEKQVKLFLAMTSSVEISFQL